MGNTPLPLLATNKEWLHVFDVVHSIFSYSCIVTCNVLLPHSHRHQEVHFSLCSSIVGQKVSTNSLMAALSDFSPSSSCLLLREYWNLEPNDTNIRVKELNMTAIQDLVFTFCAQCNKENWKSWCLYSWKKGFTLVGEKILQCYRLPNQPLLKQWKESVISTYKGNKF